MALDNFIPKNACKQCNKCKRRAVGTITCTKYPERIPHKVLVGGNCPEFEEKETKK